MPRQAYGEARRQKPEQPTRLEIGRFEAEGFGVVTRARLHVDDGLQRRIETVDEPAKTVDPSATVIIGRARESDRAGFESDEAVFGRPAFGRLAAQHANHRSDL